MGQFVILASILAGCAPSFRAESLADLVDEAHRKGLPGVIAHSHVDDAHISEAAGVSDRDGETPMTSGDLFRIASNTKMFIGYTAASLHADSSLDLDEPVSTYLSSSVLEGIANTDDATVRQMLNHTSGIPDYLGNDAFWDAVDEDPTHEWTAEEVIEYAHGLDADFTTGDSWAYSNTNYILSGLVIDAVTGAHHSEAIRSRILTPLGMDDTYYEIQEEITDPIVHGYERINLKWHDTRFRNNGLGLADGGIVSTSADLVTFIRAINGAESGLDEDAMALLLQDAAQTPDSDEYGLGVSSFPHGSGVLIGHGGNIPGYVSEVYFHPDSGSSLVVFANGSEARYDKLYEAFANRAVTIVFGESE